MATQAGNAGASMFLRKQAAIDTQAGWRSGRGSILR